MTARGELPLKDARVCALVGSLADIAREKGVRRARLEASGVNIELELEPSTRGSSPKAREATTPEETAKDKRIRNLRRQLGRDPTPDEIRDLP